MTINVQFSWQDYTTDGVQTIFAYPFYVKEKQDLAAYWEQIGTPPWHPGQPLTAPLPSAFYTLTGLGTPSGGTLVTQTPLPPGRLVLRRGTPQNQLTDYLEGDAFPAESHETALDRLTVLVQDHEEVLSRASLLRVETGTPHRGLTLPDPQPNTLLGWDSTAAQWTLYPSGVTSIPVDPVSGIGWGKNTVALTPAAGSAQASALVFPAGVLGMALTLWVETTLGQSQGLLQVGIGTPAQPDCWGYLAALTAATETTAGLFEGYSGQPYLGGEMVSLTAYGGCFDGVGTVYLTGHFATFRPSQTVGYSYHPGGPDDSAPLPMGYATTSQAGLIRLATAQEVLDGLDTLEAVTPATLQAKVDALPGVQPASESTAGITRYGTPPETVTGLLTTVATHPAGVKAAIDAQTGPLQTTVTTHTSQIAALDAKIPAGTPLSVVRYASSGQTVEASSATVVIDASGNVGVGTATPTQKLHVQDGTLLVTNTTSAQQITVNNATLAIDGPAATLRTLEWRSAGGVRWQLRVQNDAESGANVGSTLALRSYDDSGTLLRNMLWAERGTNNLGLLGVTTFGTGAVGVLALRANATAPSTSPADAVQLWGADRGAVAGKASLHLRTEDGTSHVLGDLSGIGTLCSATLGVGSYQALNVKGSLLAVLQSSVQERAAALIAPAFVVSTDASRTARLTLSVYDATAAREGLRIETSGTAPLIGFLGAPAVVRQSLAVAATDAATTQTLANSLRTALINLGLGA